MVLSGSKILALGGNVGVPTTIGAMPANRNRTQGTILSCISSGMAYAPQDMEGQSRTTAYSAAQCQERCASVSGCAHFTHFPADYGCHLQDAAASTESIPGAESGPPTCAQGLTHDIHAWVSTSTSSPAFPLNCNNDADIEARGDYMSCPQIYASADHIASLLSLVVNLRDGVVHSLVWDNGCAACGPQRCMKSALGLDPVTMLPGNEKENSGSCGQTHVHCGSDKATCDLNVLVTWAGTDKNGRHLQSAGRRLSKFGGTTMASVYETVDDTVN